MITAMKQVQASQAQQSHAFKWRSSVPFWGTLGISKMEDVVCKVYFVNRKLGLSAVLEEAFKCAESVPLIVSA